MVFITKQHKILLAATIGLIACHLPGTEGSPYIISDDRVRSLDVTPVLGRGYSIGTNSFQSTCLMVDGTTVPSYNYDCKLLFHSIRRVLYTLLTTHQ
jgi:hypothetical protein